MNKSRIELVSLHIQIQGCRAALISYGVQESVAQHVATQENGDLPQACTTLVSHPAPTIPSISASTSSDTCTHLPSCVIVLRDAATIDPVVMDMFAQNDVNDENIHNMTAIQFRDMGITWRHAMKLGLTLQSYRLPPYLSPSKSQSTSTTPRATSTTTFTSSTAVLRDKLTGFFRAYTSPESPSATTSPPNVASPPPPSSQTATAVAVLPLPVTLTTILKHTQIQLCTANLVLLAVPVNIARAVSQQMDGCLVDAVTLILSHADDQLLLAACPRSTLPVSTSYPAASITSVRLLRDAACLDVLDTFAIHDVRDADLVSINPTQLRDMGVSMPNIIKLMVILTHHQHHQQPSQSELHPLSSTPTRVSTWTDCKNDFGSTTEWDGAPDPVTTTSTSTSEILLKPTASTQRTDSYQHGKEEEGDISNDDSHIPSLSQTTSLSSSTLSVLRSKFESGAHGLLSSAMQSVVASVQRLTSLQQVHVLLSSLVDDPDVISLIVTKSQPCDLLYVKSGQGKETCHRDIRCPFSHCKSEKRKFRRFILTLQRQQKNMSLQRQQQYPTSISLATTNITNGDTEDEVKQSQAQRQYQSTEISSLSRSSSTSSNQSSQPPQWAVDVAAIYIERALRRPDGVNVMEIVSKAKSKRQTFASPSEFQKQVIAIMTATPLLKREIKAGITIFTRKDNVSSPIISSLLPSSTTTTLTRAGHGAAAVAADVDNDGKSNNTQRHMLPISTLMPALAPTPSSSSMSTSTAYPLIALSPMVKSGMGTKELLISLSSMLSHYPDSYLIQRSTMCIESKDCRNKDITCCFAHTQLDRDLHHTLLRKRQADLQNTLASVSDPVLVGAPPPLSSPSPSTTPTDSISSTPHSISRSSSHLTVHQATTASCLFPLVTIDSLKAQNGCKRMNSQTMLSALTTALAGYPDSYLQQRSTWCQHRMSCPHRDTQRCMLAHAQVDFDVHAKLLRTRHQHSATGDLENRAVDDCSAIPTSTCTIPPTSVPAAHIPSPNSTYDIHDLRVSRLLDITQFSTKDIMARSILCYELPCTLRSTCWFSHTLSEARFYDWILSQRDHKYGMQCPSEQDREQRQLAIDNREPVQIIDIQKFQGSFSDRIYALFGSLHYHSPWYVACKCYLCPSGMSCLFRTRSCYYAHTAEERAMYIVVDLKRLKHKVSKTKKQFFPGIELHPVSCTSTSTITCMSSSHEHSHHNDGRTSVNKDDENDEDYKKDKEPSPPSYSSVVRAATTSSSLTSRSNIVPALSLATPARYVNDPRWKQAIDKHTSDIKILARTVLCSSYRSSKLCAGKSCWYSHDRHDVQFYMAVMTERQQLYGRSGRKKQKTLKPGQQILNLTDFNLKPRTNLDGDRSGIEYRVFDLLEGYPRWYIRDKTNLCIHGLSCPHSTISCFHSHTARERDLHILVMMLRECTPRPSPICESGHDAKTSSSIASFTTTSPSLPIITSGPHKHPLIHGGPERRLEQLMTLTLSHTDEMIQAKMKQCIKGNTCQAWKDGTHCDHAHGLDTLLYTQIWKQRQEQTNQKQKGINAMSR